MDFCFTILGNGRRGYLERTIASWEANLKEEPKYKIIFDDSGDKTYLKWLNAIYGDRFTIVPISESKAGQPKAVQTIFDYIKDLEVDYILSIEEDWMLFRPLYVSSIMQVLELNPNIVQMRIPRTIWQDPSHSLDLKAGSILAHHIQIPGSTYKTNSDGKNSWYEWRGDFYFWSHNPAIFNKSIIVNQNYLDFSNGDHENLFGKNLLQKDSNLVAGFWAENIYDGYISHIGIREKAVLDALPNHIPNPNKNIKVGIVIPWREQPSRIKAFERVIAWYSENLPEAKIYTSNREGEVWDPSGSRNDGVSMAEADGVDVIVMSDADTIPEIDPLKDAIFSSMLDDLIHKPYTEYRAFTEPSLEQLDKGVSLKNISNEVVAGACSGTNVFSPSTWWKIGGSDEKFLGWGYEDTAMLRAHTIINGQPYVIHPGVVYAQFHELQPRKGDINYENNKTLYQEYKKCSNPKLMLNLVKRERS
jgi:hypothetical protein